MYLLQILFLSIFIAVMAVTTPINYSVQLMEGLAPAGWSKEDWASATDAMIGKTQGYILTDLIEDLAISLRITESEIRNQIDEDRTAKGLEPMPPHEDKPRGLARLRRYGPKDEVEEGDYTSYLPPGWTEGKFRTHTGSEFMELTNEQRQKIMQRQNQDPNPGHLAQIPPSVMSHITSTMQDWARKQLDIVPNVPVWKRSLAPIVQVLSLQNHEEFGFVLYRTSYKNEAAWEKFMENLEKINEIQMKNSIEGTGLEILEDRLLIPIDADDSSLDGASAQACRDKFQELKNQDAVPQGLDIGMILMADEKSIKSLGEEFDYVNQPYVWAVDMEYSEEKKKKGMYPEGYEGTFEVKPNCLLHHLWVALGSGVMSPVEVWGLMGKKELPENLKKAKEGEEKDHDEL